MKNSTKTIVTALLATVIGAGEMAAIVYAENLEEQQETESLQSLAKITLEQAKQAAEEAVGGTASSVELEVENGSLVYQVEIGQTDVVVDAGNGEVLYTPVDRDIHHLTCVQCGETSKMEGCPVKDIHTPKKNPKKFQLLFHTLEYFGLCQNCYQAQS